MNITKDNVAEVASQLSPAALSILHTMFIYKQVREFGGPNGFSHWFSGLMELLKRNIIRADYDIISGKYLAVLQPRGKRIIAFIAKGATR